jgi:succinate-acetate transporter protein
MYCWAWFILTVIFTVAAMRSSWVLWFTLFFLDIELILLACGYMLDSSTTLVAANSVGFVVAFCSCKFLAFFACAPWSLGPFISRTDSV